MEHPGGSADPTNDITAAMHCNDDSTPGSLNFALWF